MSTFAECPADVDVVMFSQHLEMLSIQLLRAGEGILHCAIASCVEFFCCLFF